MRCWIVTFATALLACSSEIPVEQPVSTCEVRTFEGAALTVCSAKDSNVEIRTSNEAGKPYRLFAALGSALGPKASDVAFAMNAGMFDEDGRAIGLLIEDGRTIHPINRNKGGGNFHLLPNGLFLVRKDGGTEVVTSDAFKSSKDIAFATQSGPMLVIDGKLHPSFDADGQSRHIRNGVGIAPDGTPLFVISNEEVSFGKLARFFRDGVNVRNALYFDGSVSSLWDPANDRRDAFAPIGPMVVVFKPAALAPGRASPATP